MTNVRRDPCSAQTGRGGPTPSNGVTAGAPWSSEPACVAAPNRDPYGRAAQCDEAWDRRYAATGSGGAERGGGWGAGCGAGAGTRARSRPGPSYQRHRPASVGSGYHPGLAPDMPLPRRALTIGTRRVL